MQPSSNQGAAGQIAGRAWSGRARRSHVSPNMPTSGAPRACGALQLHREHLGCNLPAVLPAMLRTATWDMPTWADHSGCHPQGLRPWHDILSRQSPDVPDNCLQGSTPQPGT